MTFLKDLVQRVVFGYQITTHESKVILCAVYDKPQDPHPFFAAFCSNQKMDTKVNAIMSWHLSMSLHIDLKFF